ncbi:hypothetical protein C8A05DRAFT_38983 [Staphylotrichum tortipilum]|uniref:Mediator complex subunit 22 n=1 Tax=Staphylotrichum tortipilum TaxID=2831512 RepID=A0AAN6MCF2_9PEZI|nr:hypothetical protein C8A05DRAFT_38983 [Staphylotrichum longicolle]
MDGDKSSGENLLDRKNILVAQLITAFRDLEKLATDPVDSTATIGQTAYISMATETLMSVLIKSTEDLASLTRQIRELWIVGPLRNPGSRDTEADQAVRDDAGQVLAMLNSLRDKQRQRMALQAVQAGAGFTYERGDVDGPAPPLQPQPAAGDAAAPAPVQVKTEPQDASLSALRPGQRL